MSEQILNPLLNNKPVSKKVLEATKKSQEKVAYNKKTLLLKCMLLLLVVVR